VVFVFSLVQSVLQKIMISICIVEAGQFGFIASCPTPHTQPLNNINQSIGKNNSQGSLAAGMSVRAWLYLFRRQLSKKPV